MFGGDSISRLLGNTEVAEHCDTQIREKKNNMINITSSVGFPVDIRDPYARIARGRRRKTHLLARTSMIVAADDHDPKGSIEELCTVSGANKAREEFQHEEVWDP